LPYSLDFNKINANFGDIQRQYWGNFFWGGGGVAQFGPSSRVTREGTFQGWHMQVHEHMKLIG
jgi:hypothetical protein